MFGRPFWYSVLAAGVIHAGAAAWVWPQHLHNYDAREGSTWWQMFTTKTFHVLDLPVAEEGPGDSNTLLIERRFTLPTAIQQVGLPPDPSENLRREIARPPLRHLLPEKAVAMIGGSSGDASLFGLSAGGGTFVYVLDVSGSMMEKIGGVSRLDYAKREIARSLVTLPPEAQFSIVLFADRAEVFSNDLMPAAEQIKNEAIRFMEKSRHLKGSTDMLQGISQALGFRPDVIFLITDGLDGTPETLFYSQLDYMESKAGGRTRIYPVGIQLDGEQSRLLRGIADRTGGSYRDWHGPALSQR